MIPVLNSITRSAMTPIKINRLRTETVFSSNQGKEKKRVSSAQNPSSESHHAYRKNTRTIVSFGSSFDTLQLLQLRRFLLLHNRQLVSLGIQPGLVILLVVLLTMQNQETSGEVQLLTVRVSKHLDTSPQLWHMYSCRVQEKLDKVRFGPRDELKSNPHSSSSTHLI